MSSLPLPIPATAPAATNLTSLSRLPSEVIAMIFRAYFTSTPPPFPLPTSKTSSASTARPTMTMSSGSTTRWWDQPDLADLLRVPGSDLDGPRPGTQEVWVTGELTLPDGCPTRYPKHYLIRRVNQITFMDWDAISYTAAARDVFSLWLEEHPDPWREDDEDEEGDQLPPATLFQHVEGSQKNIRLIFHPDLMDSILPTINDHPWATVLASLHYDFAHAPEVCLPMPSIPPPSLPFTPISHRIQYPLRGILGLWQPVRLTIHNADPCPRWSDWWRYGTCRIDILSMVEGRRGNPRSFELEEGLIIPSLARHLLEDRGEVEPPPTEWDDNPMSLNFYNLRSDVAIVRARLDEVQQSFGLNGDLLKVGLYSRDHDFVCSLCGKGE
ncbi:hypothetical protein IAT38_006583 [Cryptococcus sp. DSM 104549]